MVVTFEDVGGAGKGALKENLGGGQKYSESTILYYFLGALQIPPIFCQDHEDFGGPPSIFLGAHLRF